MNQPTELPAQPPTPERRDITIDALSSLFAAGRLELEDFETRVDRAVHARTVEELNALVADLHPRAEGPGASVPAPMGPDRPKGSSLTMTVLSGMERKGRWFPARHHRAFAFMGGGHLDFREAELQPGTTDVYLYVLMGGFTVVAPPDVDVEVHGWAFMGGVSDVASHPAPLETQRHKLRIHTRVVMGGVEVKVRARKGEAPPDSALPAGRGRKRLR